ncbi:unnamed protein product, partial [Adineta steineri]
MNPFSTYHIINAEDIIKANIRPNYITEDVRSLISTLDPILIINKPGLQKAENLHRQVIQKLGAKSYTLDLLKYFGYRDNGRGNYVYQPISSSDEVTARENAANEFKRFYDDLKKARDNTLDGFEDYINYSCTIPLPSYNHVDNSDGNHNVKRNRIHEPQQLSQSWTSFRISSLPPTMPNSTKVKEGNDKTSDAIKSFKKSIVTRHGGLPAHSFIRRKLLLLLFKQIYPESIEIGCDDYIDSDIDRRIGNLKQSDRNQDICSSDDVYYECLIRANFDEARALEMLRSNRPNLKPPPEPVISREPTTTTIENSLDDIDKHWTAINENIDENGAAQMLLHEGDEWKNTTHLVTAIIQLRQQHNDEEINELILSKMFRLIYSELSYIIRNLSTLKVELLAYALCKVSSETLQHLTMVDIRDIIKSCDNTHIREDFQDNAIKSLSLECIVCGDTFPRSRMESMFLCDHICCLTCTKQYYRITIKEITDRQALNRLTCVLEAHPLAEDNTKFFFQFLGTKLNQWFTDERLILDAYHENLFLATRDSQIKKCGNQRCVGFFDINHNNRIVLAQCPHCRFDQCQQCCRKWFPEHTGLTCEQYADWLRENDPDDPEVQLTKYLNTAGMICPNEQCKAIYEYQAGGCEHFTCRECHTEFCRICSALFHNPKNKSTHEIDVAEELAQKPVATGLVCPVEDCKNAPSIACENRFCEPCYKQFLCLFIWRNEIEPWELYEDNNLTQKLTNASIAVPANTTRADLIKLAQQHLTQFLGKPKQIPRIR